MYKKEFDGLLRAKKEFCAYMFFGQSDYLIEKYANLVATSVADGEEIEKIYFDDFDFKYAKDKLLQSSLFASKNVLLIKLAKKLNKNDTTQLIEACNTNPDSTVIFACMGDGDFKTMGSYFTNKNNSVSVRMFTPYPSEAIQILESEARSLGLRYEVSALNHLFFMHRNDLNLSVNDLKKLAILDEESISSKLVEIHCFGIGSVSLEDFLFNLLNGQLVKRDLHFLLEEGMNEINLLTQIAAFVHQLFMISSYSRTIGTPNAREILGYVPPQNIWEKKTQLAIKIKPELFLELFNFLNDLELDLKSSKIPDHNAYIQASLRKFSDKLR